MTGECCNNFILSSVVKRKLYLLCIFVQTLLFKFGKCINSNENLPMWSFTGPVSVSIAVSMSVSFRPKPPASPEAICLSGANASAKSNKAPATPSSSALSNHPGPWCSGWIKSVSFSVYYSTLDMWASYIQRPNDQKSLECLTFEPLSGLIGSPELGRWRFLRSTFIGRAFLVPATRTYMRLAFCLKTHATLRIQLSVRPSVSFLRSTFIGCFFFIPVTSTYETCHIFVWDSVLGDFETYTKIYHLKQSTLKDISLHSSFWFSQNEPHKCKSDNQQVKYGDKDDNRRW